MGDKLGGNGEDGKQDGSTISDTLLYHKRDGGGWKNASHDYDVPKKREKQYLHLLKKDLFLDTSVFSIL